MNPLVHRFLRWAVRRAVVSQDIHGSNDEITVIERYAIFWPDEYTNDDGTHEWRPPWWRPFNILLHEYVASMTQTMHDHPRWSITILLAGKAIEHTPWGSRILTPGSIVIRSRKYIHSIEIPEDSIGKTWTLFIVGRRNHLQNDYEVIKYDREY